jgi:NAD-dependent deacetylase
VKRLIVLTGAGISKESGLSTFREQDGLWEQHAIEDVATPKAWYANPDLVTQFYNERRRQLFLAEPNAAHLEVKNLETHFDVQVITQNVDDLHERAGSKNILHLHGKLNELRSQIDPKEIHIAKNWKVTEKDVCSYGKRLRPNIVWFGEDVPLMPVASELVRQCDILVVIGTSLQVYPAANLLRDAPLSAKIFLIDPNELTVRGIAAHRIHHIKEPATKGVQTLRNFILANKS